MDALTPVPAAPVFGQAHDSVSRWTTRALQLSLLAAAVTLYLMVLAGALQRHQDLDTYIRAGQDLWSGHPLYAPFLGHPFPDPTLRPAFIYPPIFAVLIAPLTVVPRPVAIWVWLVSMQAALAIGGLLISRSSRASRTGVLVAIIGTLTFYPLWVDTIQGQANLLVLLLVALGLTAVAGGQARGGLWLGLAAALKLTPGLLVGWLVVERRFRAAAWMAAGFAIATGLGATIRLDDTVSFFRDVVPALAKGTAYYSNQSLSGFFARILTANTYTEPWGRLSWEPALVLLVGLLMAGWWAWHRDSDGLRSALTYLPLLPLLSVVTWEHHLVILLPLLWLCATQLAQRGWPVLDTALLTLVALCLSGLPRLHLGPAFGDPGFRAAQTADPFVLLTTNTLLIGTVMLFLISPWLLRKR